ncbi:GTP-binding proten HflX [Desulfofarcimen acetoxidans DSM 771]|uniref:GTPase HflX n=1 Tax=Desulfofarcimen acetoxidans (strain ATCC 49208 / DSM 771 / KCTC 5769 / VKM B-1644 / 5575) TaxID=485916 RepID=C8VW36_DESAS|nr:GTPase HflX [Desulfofarcimen acetoxidans]ACV64323.1 GTP-binding proten HflX [Desulfofarcimen acetoxidans DSM 771]
MENLEKVILVGIELPGMSSEQVEESMNELAALADTAGAEAVDSFIQRRNRPDSKYFIGKGKAEETSQRCRELEAQLVIFDHELSPSQIRNLIDLMEVRVLDRTQLILDIFAQRASTKEGKLQVELAQLKYLLPRLTGQGKFLSRLGGGIGTRGPGETKLETDRRRLRERIVDIQAELEEVKKHRALLRKGRKQVPVVSLVGYTNAGKSTLLNKLTGSDVLVEDKLFATLDPTTRQVILPNNDEILVTDTVGFIQNLPHHLVAAFRATLEEVIEADLLLHVVDSTHPNCFEQYKAVQSVLSSLEVENKPSILVLNKADGLPKPDLNLWINIAGTPVTAISALTGEGLPGLLETIAKNLAYRRVRTTFLIPYAKGYLLSQVHEQGLVLSEEHGNDGVRVEVEIERVWAERIAAGLK